MDANGIALIVLAVPTYPERYSYGLIRDCLEELGKV